MLRLFLCAMFKISLTDSSGQRRIHLKVFEMWGDLGDDLLQTKAVSFSINAALDFKIL